MSEERMSMNCSRCGGKLVVDTNRDTIVCEFCGTSYSTATLLGESDSVRIEKMKTQAYVEVEAGKRAVETEYLKHSVEQEKAKEKKEELRNFKKSKLSKALVIFALIGVLLWIISFADGQAGSCIVATIMVALFAVAWLMGMQIVKEKKTGMRTIATILAFAMIVPYFAFYDVSNAEKFEWEDFELGYVLPQPESDWGVIYSNSDDYLSVDIHKVSEDEYRDYLEECKSIGFTVDSKRTDTNYYAFNQEGFKLSLYYYENNKEMDVTLNAPMEMTSINWPINENSKLLPAPNSNKGHISSDSSTGFTVYISDVSKENFVEYVNKCANNGFNVDYYQGNDSFSAYNKEGYRLALSYEGYNIMCIDFDVPDDKSTDNDVETKKSTTKTYTTNPTTQSITQADSSVIRPDFKEAMDSYEEFYNEYIDFMNKYAESDGSDLSLLSDYVSYMEKYNDMAEKFEAWEDEDLNTAEMAYYLDVQNRINKKMLELAD